MAGKKLDEVTMNNYVATGQYAELKKLVKKGVDLNLRSMDNCTLFVIAARNGHWNILGFLIDCGADLNSYDDDYKWTFLHYSARNGWLPAIQIYIDRDLDLEVKTAKGQSPLMIAAEYNNTETINMLFNAGANINSCDCKGWTALHHSASMGYERMTKFLLQKGINVNAQDVRGYTALHLAIKKGCDIEMIGFLLRAGTDCNLRNYKGTTAFNLLTGKDLMGAIRLAIEKGAVVTLLDYQRLQSLALLKSIVLSRLKYCSQAIINKFNNQDLPTLYKLKYAADILPAINILKIKGGGEMPLEIDRVVKREIQTAGFCNLIKVQPICLSMFCVTSFLSYVYNVQAARQRFAEQNQPSCSNSELKRKAIMDRLAIMESGKKQRLEK